MKSADKEINNKGILALFRRRSRHRRSMSTFRRQSARTNAGIECCNTLTPFKGRSEPPSRVCPATEGYNQRTASRMKGFPTKSEIIQTVTDSVGVVRPDVLTVTADTPLVGPNAVLDSVGFVTLLIALEENLDSTVDLSASFLEQNDIEGAGDPFSTVGSLADHILGLLSKR